MLLVYKIVIEFDRFVAQVDPMACPMTRITLVVQLLVSSKCYGVFWIAVVCSKCYGDFWIASVSEKLVPFYLD